MPINSVAEWNTDQTLNVDVGGFGIIRESVGTVKVFGGKLQIYNDHHLLTEVHLTDRQKLQLIAEPTDELRYPKQPSPPTRPGFALAGLLLWNGKSCNQFVSNLFDNMLQNRGTTRVFCE